MNNSNLLVNNAAVERSSNIRLEINKIVIGDVRFLFITWPKPKPAIKIKMDDIRV